MTSTIPRQSTEEVRKDLIHYTSWACLIAGPIILILPPRKLDLYTLGVLLGTFAGANEVSREQTGISMIDRMGQRFMKSTASLPPQAVELQQRRIREEREKQQQKLLVQKIVVENDLSQQSSSMEEFSAEQSRKPSGFWSKVWMGGEGKNWKEERLRKERDALESGKGYFDLIMEQVWEVWNNGESEATAEKPKAGEYKDLSQEKPYNPNVENDKKR
ncbi:putative rhomboid family membrane protein [Erysiphe neolycopersici]|uniref:Putative rhomboid family membrane protein n=1 Tax=Erysiphe neolycopersici TaxID=212602 RepID=A0A420HIK3_9PEZI|nr:putative rhomboid family membrane protein [Erysiphe neolycopersici]